MRGKVPSWITVTWTHRITPACAGKSLSMEHWFFALRDHPRMCGEKHCAPGQGCGHAGSPPHVRGKEGRPHKEGAVAGITPACAGKRNPSGRKTTRARDHPRMCGEKYKSRRKDASAQGSPPHVRGKAMAQISRSEGGGDHPRMCGEKCLKGVMMHFLSGSPPHVRGKGCVRDAAAAVQGITPACAGKSMCRVCLRCLVRDHPRMCGEKTKKIP